MLLLLLACTSKTPEDSAVPEVYIAMQSNFSGFKDWEAIPVSTGDTGHVDGDRTVYINHRPPAGATEFPVGTMIVKTIAWSGGLDVHARAKRGGGFNPEGAGWEWFELTLLPDDTPVMLWRGASPPDGEDYQSLPDDSAVPTVNGDCNTCHSAASDNDTVFSVGL